MLEEVPVESRAGCVLEEVPVRSRAGCVLEEVPVKSGSDCAARAGLFDGDLRAILDLLVGIADADVSIARVSVVFSVFTAQAAEVQRSASAKHFDFNIGYSDLVSGVTAFEPDVSARMRLAALRNSSLGPADKISAAA